MIFAAQSPELPSTPAPSLTSSMGRLAASLGLSRAAVNAIFFAALAARSLPWSTAVIETAIAISSVLLGAVLKVAAGIAALISIGGRAWDMSRAVVGRVLGRAVPAFEVLLEKVAR